MLEINTYQNESLKFVTLKGRIDGITSSELEKEINLLASEGDRVIVMNMECVNYVSSAGLRVFLSTQKMLKKIGGELLLLTVPPQVMDVFNTSGFASFFKTFTDERELVKNSGTAASDYLLINGMKYHYRKLSSPKGKLFLIGNHLKLQDELYSRNDVTEVNSFSIRFGSGVAVLGDNYDDYKNLFGETVILNHSFFSYPAAKKSAVDYMLKDQINSLLRYKFLYGFGITGGFSAVMKIPEDSNYVSLHDVISAAQQLAQSNMFGAVIIAESGGVFAMNLKQSPLTENKPAAEGIFSPEHFADWIDFPLEPAFRNNIVAAAGLIVKDKNIISDDIKPLFSEDSCFHIHTALFEKDFLSKNINSFDDELNRITKDLQPLKVQHLLSKSRFKSGMLGIIELEDN